MPVTALRLGVAMTALQASIGALNDVVDAPRDRGLKPAKPIPAGLVSPRAAWVVVAVAAGLGVGLSIPSGAATVGLAIVVLAIGYGYDLVFKGTAWSWFPFAIGIPLLPVFGWLGTTGGLPDSFAILLPVAVIAGAALAIANARADAERDAAAGVVSVATRLGLGAVVGRQRGPAGRRRRPGDRDAGGSRRTAGRHCSVPSGRAWWSGSAWPSAVAPTAPDANGPGSSKRSGSVCWLRPGWPGRRSVSSPRRRCGPARWRSRGGAW